ncbi:MAG: 50S ribosomal protein L25 [Akkermansiaceae bacterium]|jgi:large subunit ribosomal protein L25|nr:50S ribosomal protein L25 [Akkermansiaceae bacterium]MDP4646729.1 50S ribosomal protein L25 [Akkermansiaceae bacterium]MDP4721062.1 50S ribosomal protein L25 [Akkermansiaceae bacterium]MDP4779645.1 50S ribosomal protein L25 [Akkermansiaceae bacterium]MDP4846275.1 50S ribosomal protein L25 [Akkermansiaceae bacterium]
MSKKTTLKAAPRLRSGSGKLKQMRREGWLPSVVYGRGVENENLKIDAKTFSELLAHSSSDSILINLDVEGEGTRSVFLKTIQHDPLTGKALHVDFLSVNDKTEITANIPIHLTGESKGVKAGGILEQYAHTIEITCFPKDLPEELEHDITALGDGDSLHIGEISFPSGVTPTHGAEVVVAHIGKPAALVSEEASGTDAAAAAEVPATSQKEEAEPAAAE